MKTYIVPGLLLVGTLFFTYLYVVGPQQPKDFALPKAGKGRVSYNQVEQLRKETQIKMGIEHQQVQLEKQLRGPELDPGKSQRNQFHKTVIPHGANPKEIDLSEHRLENSQSLEQKMNEFLAKKQRFEELAESQKKQYVQSFIQEAKAMGYKVQVDKNLEIVKIEKID